MILYKVIAMRKHKPPLGTKSVGVPIMGCEIPRFPLSPVCKRRSSSDFRTPPHKRPREEAPPSNTILRQRMTEDTERGRIDIPKMAELTPYNPSAGTSGDDMQQLIVGAHAGIIKSVQRKEFLVYKSLFEHHQTHRSKRPNVATPIQISSVQMNVLIPKFEYTLQSLIDMRQFPSTEKEAISVWTDLLHQLLSGLDHLHTITGHISADVKPDNIGIDHKYGAVRLFDFGCAAKIGDTETVSGASWYKPKSMQEKRTRYVSGFEDIYAVGVVMEDLAKEMKIEHVFFVKKTIIKLKTNQEETVQTHLNYLLRTVDLDENSQVARSFWEKIMVGHTKREQEFQAQLDTVSALAQSELSEAEKVRQALGLPPAPEWGLSSGGDMFAGFHQQLLGRSPMKQKKKWPI